MRNFRQVLVSASALVALVLGSCETSDSSSSADGRVKPPDSSSRLDGAAPSNEGGSACPQPAGHGSCTASDKMTCTLYSGGFWTSTSAKAACTSGLFSASCGCTESGATGKCVFAKGLNNEYVDVYYQADVSKALLECMKLGTWQSTPASPDLTWVCKEEMRSYSSFGGMVDECGKKWTCGPTTTEYQLACKRNTSGTTPTYDCECLKGATKEKVFSDPQVCGTTAGSPADNDALLVNAAKASCGWKVTDDPTI